MTPTHKKKWSCTTNLTNLNNTNKLIKTFYIKIKSTRLAKLLKYKTNPIYNKTQNNNNNPTSSQPSFQIA